MVKKHSLLKYLMLVQFLSDLSISSLIWLSANLILILAWFIQHIK